MLSYNETKARAWEHYEDSERITKATITWVDAEYEYDLEIENEDRWGDEGFAEWVNENAEELARKAAEKEGTTFEEILSIDYATECYDDDAAFEAGYLDACELEGDYMREMGW